MFSCSTLPPIPEHKLYTPAGASRLNQYGSRYLGKVTLGPGADAQDKNSKTREKGSTDLKLDFSSPWCTKGSLLPCVQAFSETGKLPCLQSCLQRTHSTHMHNDDMDLTSWPHRLRAE